MRRIRILDGNFIKILGCIFMAFDHIGVALFPKVAILRYIGRLAFPIFAFMIAEGAKYTRNKVKYFLMIFIIGVICQVFNYFFNNHDLYMCIFITFSISILLIYLLQISKHIIFNTKGFKPLKVIGCIIVYSLVLIGIYVLNNHLEIDYGFYGIITPVLVSLCDFRNIKINNTISKIDNHYTRLILLAIGLLLTSIYYGGYQYLSLLSLVILFFYSGKKGKYNMKYFFYIFYPLHLAIIYGISLLM